MGKVQPKGKIKEMRKIRTYQEVSHDTGSELLEQVIEQQERLADRLSQVKCLVAIASGKGGVGKSAITANLAAGLASRGFKVGATDADLNGPSLGRMLNVSGATLVDSADGVEPAMSPSGVSVMSMELLQSEADAPLKWREPAMGGFIWQSSMETGVLREFLGDVVWGDLDVLLIDVPPGTDKIKRLLELLPSLDLLLLVTTPSETTRFVVAKSIRLAQEAMVDNIGLVENMESHVCSSCGHVSRLFGTEAATEEHLHGSVSLWGSIPFDPRLGALTDQGDPLITAEPESAASSALQALVERVSKHIKGGKE